MVLSTLIGVLAVASLLVILLSMAGVLDTTSMRGEAVTRLTLGNLWFLIATPLFIIWFLVGFALMVIDVLLQGLTGMEGIMPMNLHARAYDWYASNVDWLFYGRGEFDALPYV